MQRFARLSFLFLILLITAPAFAETAKGGDAELKAIKADLMKKFPGVPEEAISQTPIDGLLQITNGVEVFYLSADGRYLIQGAMIDIAAKKNLTEETQTKLRADYMAKLPLDEMVVFSPDKPKHTITVFTDIDCGYCRKLHQEIDSYMKQGIAVRYMFFPRAGVGSPSYQKAVNVWCADDRKDAMTKAKNGVALPDKQCDNPVASQLKLGAEMGVTGTPVIFTEKGDKIPGYVPAQRLSIMLDQLESS
jgi:thiol:disulfide interchange protein DsbC